MRRHTRPLAELWPLWKERTAAGAHPFQFTVPHDVERIVTGLRSYDRDGWAAAFSAAAAPYQNDAEDAEQNGDTASARRNYLRAYGYYRLALYPTTNSDAKLAAFRQSQELLLRAARYLTIPVERVEIPFRGQNRAYTSGSVGVCSQPRRLCPSRIRARLDRIRAVGRVSL